MKTKQGAEDQDPPREHREFARRRNAGEVFAAFGFAPPVFYLQISKN
jgi:hypothetical protein